MNDKPRSPKRPRTLADRPSNRMNQRFGNRRAAKRRRGYALLLVMVIILTSTAFAAVHQRHLSAALRLEQARIASEDYNAGPVSVLAIACDRLESGDPPPSTNYRYSHTVNGNTQLYRISYTVSGTQWTVVAEPDATAGSYPLLPASF
ncbi:MAG: hypothetical protein HKN47_04845 [Pirellulaceae bacterium]|nr:hypothetical protein [Pirellulaceae bacterium]